MFADDDLTSNEWDLKNSTYAMIAQRLGLSERRPIPDPMPFTAPDPLGASILEGDGIDTSDLGTFVIARYSAT